VRISSQKAKLVEGGAESIVYSTIAGGIGAIQPFVKSRDANLLMRLGGYSLKSAQKSPINPQKSPV